MHSCFRLFYNFHLCGRPPMSPDRICLHIRLCGRSTGMSTREVQKMMPLRVSLRREPMLHMGARLASGSGIMFLQKTPDLQSHEGDAGPEDDKLLRQAGEAFVRHTEDAEAVQTKLDRIAGIDQSAKTAEAERTIGVEAATSSAASSMWYSLRN